MLQNIFRLMAKKYYKFTVSDRPLMSYKRPLTALKCEYRDKRSNHFLEDK